MHLGLVKLKTKKNVLAQSTLGIFIVVLIISDFISQWKGGICCRCKLISLLDTSVPCVQCCTCLSDAPLGQAVYSEWREWQGCLKALLFHMPVGWQWVWWGSRMLGPAWDLSANPTSATYTVYDQSDVLLQFWASVPSYVKWVWWYFQDRASRRMRYRGAGAAPDM